MSLLFPFNLALGLLNRRRGGSPQAEPVAPDSQPSPGPRPPFLRQQEQPVRDGRGQSGLEVCQHRPALAAAAVEQNNCFAAASDQPASAAATVDGHPRLATETGGGGGGVQAVTDNHVSPQSFHGRSIIVESTSTRDGNTIASASTSSGNGNYRTSDGMNDNRANQLGKPGEAKADAAINPWVQFYLDSTAAAIGDTRRDMHLSALNGNHGPDGVLPAIVPSLAVVNAAGSGTSSSEQRLGVGLGGAAVAPIAKSPASALGRPNLEPRVGNWNGVISHPPATFSSPDPPQLAPELAPTAPTATSSVLSRSAFFLTTATQGPNPQRPSVSSVPSMPVPQLSATAQALLLGHAPSSSHSLHTPLHSSLHNSALSYAYYPYSPPQALARYPMHLYQHHQHPRTMYHHELQPPSHHHHHHHHHPHPGHHVRQAQHDPGAAPGHPGIQGGHHSAQSYPYPAAHPFYQHHPQFQPPAYYPTSASPPLAPAPLVVPSTPPPPMSPTTTSPHQPPSTWSSSVHPTDPAAAHLGAPAPLNPTNYLLSLASISLAFLQPFLFYQATGTTPSSLRFAPTPSASRSAAVTALVPKAITSLLITLFVSCVMIPAFLTATAIAWARSGRQRALRDMREVVLVVNSRWMGEDLRHITRPLAQGLTLLGNVIEHAPSPHLLVTTVAQRGASLPGVALRDQVVGRVMRVAASGAPSVALLVRYLSPLVPRQALGTVVAAVLNAGRGAGAEGPVPVAIQEVPPGKLESHERSPRTHRKSKASGENKASSKSAASPRKRKSATKSSFGSSQASDSGRLDG